MYVNKDYHKQVTWCSHYWATLTNINRFIETFCCYFWNPDRCKPACYLENSNKISSCICGGREEAGLVVNNFPVFFMWEHPWSTG